MSAEFQSPTISELVKMSLGSNKGSWWADPGFGSQIYRIEKVDSRTPALFQSYCTEALQWLLDEALAAEIRIGAERRGRSAIAYRIEISRPNGETELLESVWQA